MNLPDGPLRPLHLCDTTGRRGAELSTVDLASEFHARGLSSQVMAMQPGQAGEQPCTPVVGTTAVRPRSAGTAR